jgi:hypothetical protein
MVSRTMETPSSVLRREIGCRPPDDGKTGWIIEPHRNHHWYFYVVIVVVTVVGVGVGVLTAAIIFFGLIARW